MTKRNAESHVRTVIDLVLIDRLKNLVDKESLRKLSVTPEVSLTAQGEDEDGKLIKINGRSDWTILFGDASKKADTVLLAVEAKGEGAAYIGLP